MNGLTILETVTTIQEPNIGLVITIIIVADLVGLSLLVLTFLFAKEDNAVMYLTFSTSALCIILSPVLCEYLPTKEVDLGYEQIIAYVDLSITSEEQIKEKYEIISQNGEIYTLREKEKITEDVVQSKHVHQWEVTDTNEKEDGTEYIIECTECQQKKQISN